MTSDTTVDRVEAAKPMALAAVHLLNALTPRFPQHRALRRVLLDADRVFAWEYEEGERALAGWRPSLDVRGRRVLDLGSALGAQALLYSRLGAASVVGLDLNHDKVVRATARLAALADTEPAAGRVRFVQGDAAQMPFPSGVFDRVVSNSTFEHISAPDAALAECARVLRPGGLAYLRYLPYWGPWGAHLDRWIKFPWCHVLFSEATLLAAVRQIEARQDLNTRYLGCTHLDLGHPTRFMHVNRLTIAQLEGLLQGLPLRVVHAYGLPIGHVFVPRLAERWGAPLAYASQALHALADARPSREYVCAAFVIVVERTADAA